ncbi:MAG: carboxypeptidase regulatory-like domain-containing protein [Myxococcota bacterium]
MARGWVRAGLVLGAVGVVVALVAGEHDDPAAAPPAAEHDSAHKRAAPDEATVAARKRRALRELANRASEPTRTIKVRVVDCGLTPAANATVTVLADGEPVAGLADEVGVFRAPVPLDASEVSATVTLETATGTRRGAASGAGDLDVSICPGATVSGVVRDAEGRPLRDAVVRFGDDQDVAVTDSDGEFVLSDQFLTADRVLVEHALGTAELALAPALAPGEERQADLVVESGRRVVGSVVDANGAAVPNVAVTAVDASGQVLARVSSDRDGRFWLKKLPFEALRVRADGGARGVGETTLAARETPAELVGRLAADRGTLVVFWEGDEPGSIFVTGSGFEDDVEQPAIPREPIALASGAELVTFAPASYRAFVRTAHGETPCGEGVLFSAQRLVFRCGRPRDATLLARVLGPDGAPRAGVAWAVRVQLPDGPVVDASGETDAAGRMRAVLQLDRAAAARIEVGRPDGQTDPLSRRNVMLTPGGTNDLGDLQLRDQAAVAAMFTERETGSFGGLGGQLRTDDVGVAFARIVRNGPLDQAGVRAGDIVLDIDGQPASQLTEREVMLRLRGEPGSAVDLHLMRPGEGQLQISLDRAVIDLHSSGWVD